ncbi:MAG: Asp-tRNA(Asn)/Glu-tRNA(Gln) amidotransferase subunit GatC [Candidatus Bipolaricaulota bacterium]
MDEQTMSRVEELAGLRLSPEERVQLMADLGRILDHFNKLQELPTAGVPPFTPLPEVNVWREDEPTPSLPREEALRNAPDVQDGHFRVPPVFED